MEVTQSNDHITHAVIGGQEIIECSITDSAEFFHMLSSTLYSDQQLAIVRETIFNCLDAHVEAKCVDKPIEITISDTQMVFRDFGLGIPREMIGAVYGTYGKSTKTKDKNSTGGFGLGCKSPFAYTDHFQVVSMNQGTKTIYAMSKSSAERQGKPGITPIVSMPTTESGLEVTITFVEPDHYRRFFNLVKRIGANSDRPIMLNGKLLDTIPFDSAPHGFLITKEKILEGDSTINVRYGGIVYPVPIHSELNDLEHEVSVLLESAEGHSNQSWGYRGGSPKSEYSLVLQAKPDSLTITPSRESISLDGGDTLAVIKDLLQKFVNFVREGSKPLYLKMMKKAVDITIAKGDMSAILKRNDPSAYTRNLLESNNSRLTTLEDIASSSIHYSYPRDQNFLRKDQTYRLSAIVKATTDPLKKGYLQRLLRVSAVVDNVERATQTKLLYQKHVMSELLLKVNSDVLNRGNMHVIAAQGDLSSWGGRSLNDDIRHVSEFHPEDVASLIPFSERRVVLAHTLKGVILDYRVFRDISDPDYDYTIKSAGAFVFVVSRHAKQLEKARKILADSGYEVADLTLSIQKRAPRSKPTEKVVKLTGYPTLNSARPDCVGIFSQENARSAEQNMRVDKPIAYTFVHSRSAKGFSKDCLPDFSSAFTCTNLQKLYGDKIAVVFSEPSAEKLEDAGVPSLETFTEQMLTKELQSNKKLRNYLSYNVSHAINSAHAENMSAGEQKLLSAISENSELAKAFKIHFECDEREQRLIKIWAQLNEYARAYPPEWIKQIRQEIKTIEPSKPMAKLMYSIIGSSTAVLIDTATLPEQNFLSKDPALLAGVVKVIKTAIKG